MTQKKTHAKMFPPSASERWLNCHASVKLSEKAPPQAESKYAEEGTKAHTVLEELLKAHLRRGRRGGRGKLKPTDGPHPKEMVDAAKLVVNYVESVAPFGEKVLIEEKSETGIHPDFFGTLDVAVITEDELIVIDFKYGAGVAVEAEENPQLMAYAIGVAEKYVSYGFKKVRLVIIQPRAFHPEGEIREYFTTIETVWAWRDKFKKAIDKIVSGENLEFKSGDHCRWCPAATICPEISSKALRDAKMDFEVVTGEIVAPNPKQIQIAHLSQILNAADKIEAWLKQVRDHAETVLNTGEKIEGWKLVPKRSTRKWVNPEKVLKEGLKKFGKEILTIPELLSPAQFEKVTGNKAWVKERVVDISSGLTLVRDTDKRDATTQAQLDFKND